jgi:FKBP-type peptidyl-prolyl cis-trans isomerase FkpA
MKTKILLEIIGLCGLFLFSGCLKNENEALQNDENAKLKKYIDAKYPAIKPTADGLYYIEAKQGTGTSVGDSDYVLINTSWYLIDEYTLIGTNDTSLAIRMNVFPFVSYKGPVKYCVRFISVGGLREGLKMMKEGGKAKLIVPSKLAFDGYNFYDIPKYSTLIINIELVRVIKDPIADDKHFLNQYLDTLQMTEGNISDGIYMKTDKEGTGDAIQSLDTVSFKFIDKAVDTIYALGSSKYLNYKFIIDQDSIFRGLRVAIGKLKKGSEARVLLPYNMVEGVPGYARYPWILDVPPYTSLYYHLVINDVKKGYYK